MALESCKCMNSVLIMSSWLDLVWYRTIAPSSGVHVFSFFFFFFFTLLKLLKEAAYQPNDIVMQKHVVKSIIMSDYTMAVKFRKLVN